jgi:hypothetical protein
MPVVAGGYSYFIEFAKTEAIDMLINGLNRFNQPEMAFDFVNCEKEQLVRAGVQWSARQGYGYKPEPEVVHIPSWGKSLQENR